MICPDFLIVNNSPQDGVDNILFTYENTELRRALRNLANARDISYSTVSHKRTFGIRLISRNYQNFKCIFVSLPNYSQYKLKKNVNPKANKIWIDHSRNKFYKSNWIIVLRPKTIYIYKQLKSAKCCCNPMQTFNIEI